MAYVEMPSPLFPGRERGVGFDGSRPERERPSDSPKLTVEQRLGAVRERIAAVTQARLDQMTASIDYAIEHPQESIHVVGEVTKKAGKNLATWGSVGFAVRGVASVIGSAVDVVGRPVSVASAMVVKGIRDGYTEWKDHRDKSGRSYFQDHVGILSFKEESYSVWGKVTRGVRTASRGLVDTGLRYAYRVDEHRKDVEMLYQLTHEQSSEEILEHLRDSDVEITQVRLLDYMKMAKLGIDTAVDHSVRMQARESMQRLYKAALLYGKELGEVSYTVSGEGKIWNEKVKEQFKAMSKDISNTLDNYSDKGFKLAIGGRIAHTPVTAGISAFIGGLVFEHTVAQTEWYKNAQLCLRDFLQARFQTVSVEQTAQPEVHVKVSEPTIATAHASSTAYYDAYEGQGYRSSYTDSGSYKRMEPPPEPPRKTKLGFPVVDARDEIKKEAWELLQTKAAEVKLVVVGGTVEESAIPAKITVEKGDGLFKALNRCGFNVLQEGSGARFVQRVAVTFNPTTDECRILDKIIRDNPQISADNLRVAAIHEGMDFDGRFTVYAGDYEIPGVELSHADLVRNSQVVRDIRDSVPYTSAVVAEPVQAVVSESLQMPSTAPTSGIRINMSGVTPLRIGQADSVASRGIRISMPQRLRLGGIDGVRQSSGIRIGSINTLPLNVHINTADAGVQINAPVSVNVPTIQEAIVAAAPIVDVAPITTVQEQVPEWYRPYTEFDQESVRAYGMDWSSGNLSKLKITSHEFNMDNKRFKLFRHEENGLRAREWNQQLQTEMHGRLRDEWVQYDPVKNNVIIYTHASGDTFGETVRMLAEGVDKAGTIPPYGDAQINARMQMITNSEADITIIDPTTGIDQRFDLTGMTRWSNDQLDDKFTHQGNYFNFFKDLPGEKKVYVIFCGAYYSEAMKLLTSPNLSITDQGVLDSIAALQNGSVQGQEYAQHMSKVLGYLKSAPTDSAERNLYDVFVKELYSPKSDYDRLSYTRYVMEFTPVQ